MREIIYVIYSLFTQLEKNQSLQTTGLRVHRARTARRFFLDFKQLISGAVYWKVGVQTSMEKLPIGVGVLEAAYAGRKQAERRQKVNKKSEIASFLCNFTKFLNKKAYFLGFLRSTRSILNTFSSILTENSLFSLIILAFSPNSPTKKSFNFSKSSFFSLETKEVRG